MRHRHGGHGDWGPPHAWKWMRHGFGPPWAGGPKVRRGDVRLGILGVLAERPMHGYEVIGELERRSGGRWRPSPGSIYPTLQFLEDEGLVKGEDRDGRRVFEITEEGRQELESKSDRGPAWDEPADDRFGELRGAAFQLGAAAMQVAGTGTSEQVARTREILDEARKKIYGILAES